MNNWKSKLKGDPIPWLLEPDNPSVRYLTLRDILEKKPDDPEVRKSKAEIMNGGPVPRILDRMHPEGHWEAPERFYTAKYRGTVWQMIILAELHADGSDRRIQAARDFLLKVSQDPESGAFAHRWSVRAGGGSHSEVIPCLTGNMVFALIRLGYADHPQVRLGIDWINRYQRFDDRTADPPRGWPYDRYEMCWGRHTCHMGAIKALKALAEIPVEKRSRDTGRTLKQGAEYFLRHHVFKKSHDLDRVSKPGWLRLGFPLMYQTDILEITGILLKLGYRDGRMREAMDIILKRQNSDGRWTLQQTFNGRFQVNIEAKGKPGKWITLNAIKAIKDFYR